MSNVREFIKKKRAPPAEPKVIEVPYQVFKGPKGDRGEQGEQGLQGPIGPRGIDGRDGRNGKDADSTLLETLRKQIKRHIRCFIIKSPLNWGLLFIRL